jgi:hypothetical protein
MATQYGINTTEFFGMPIPSNYLRPGNIVVVQDINSEDNLYAVNSCYTEIRHISRVYNSKVVTFEPNLIPFTGIVVFGKPTFGLKKLHHEVYASSQGVSTYNKYNFPSDLSQGEYIKIQEQVYYINNVTYDIQNGYTLVTEPAPKPGWYEAYTQIKTYSIPTYTDKINALTLKLAGSIIQRGIIRRLSMSSLTKEFLRVFMFAYSKFAMPYVIHSVYNPEYFAILKYATPRVPYSILIATTIKTSTTSIVKKASLIKRKGLYIEEQV